MFALETLQQYALVSYRERQVDVWTQQASGAWTVETRRDGDVSLASTGAKLGVRDLDDAVGEAST